MWFLIRVNILCKSYFVLHIPVSYLLTKPMYHLMMLQWASSLLGSVESRIWAILSNLFSALLCFICLDDQNIRTAVSQRFVFYQIEMKMRGSRVDKNDYFHSKAIQISNSAGKQDWCLKKKYTLINGSERYLKRW